MFQSLKFLILVSGGRNKARTEQQRVGRTLRQYAGKEHALVYDFLDLQHPLMAKHAKARMALYASLNFSQQPLPPGGA